MAAAQRLRDGSCRALLCFVLVAAWEAASGQIRYSIPEEMAKGAFVGNVAKDLGLDTEKISERGVRILAEGRTQYFALNFESGHLYISERVDREELCGRSSNCLLRLEILVQVKLHTVEIEITDINDNAPRFQVEQIELRVRESTATGARFLLPDAEDPDVGINSLQSYQLSDNRHFSLDVQTGADGAKYAELVLEMSLDREKQAVHNLILRALDGGDPLRSGTAQINVVVEDANDNAPIFAQSLYKVNVLEDTPVGSLLVTVNATDLDEGINSQVTYTFRKISEKASSIFHLDAKTGEMTVAQKLDFEECELYETEVQARDGRGLSGRAKVLLNVLDVNDNNPEVTVTSFSSSVPEGSPTGTVIALLKVRDRDSGENGEVTCSIFTHLPFRLQKSYDNFYSLVTDGPLDREQVSEYNVTITARDRGNPPLSTITALSLKILDKNDNPPTFTQTSYAGYIAENNPRGASIFTLEASDPDWGENARVTYSLLPGGEGSESPVSSSISIHSESGAVYALRSFDYEQLRELRFQVQAQDGGSPPLSTNVSVTLWILDQNDNSPEILYPASRSDGSTGVELAPRSSEPGYLVTKVVAVDADSGQNAWLSYQLLKATEPGLFRVGLQSGEIRTARSVLDKDALKQSLVVLVKDNGQPPLSASVSVTVVLADSLPQILSELSSLSSPVSSSISIHSESGAVYALRSFDYEQLRELRFQVQAQDGGSPPLSTNVSVTLWILDQNDNSPEILYPASPSAAAGSSSSSSRSDGSTGVELAPRSSEPGYLVTKVVAVDADSGQNAWLSYQLLKATEPGLFRVGLQSGEIRTARSVLDKDALKQSLVVLVKDNGQPPLSASVSVTVVLADSLPQILSELSSLSASAAAAAAGGGGGAEPQPGLTLYLGIAVASVSGLFFSFLLGLLALRLRRWRNSPLLESGASGNFSGVPVSQFVGIDGVRAFLHSYSQEASLTAGSRKSQILFPVVSCTNTLTAQQAQEKPAPLLITEDSKASQQGETLPQVSFCRRF
uniref:Cadherin domain-containing protein n=1 Tax=Sphenodon punctatus TaxID=8508 RepID=A0A8D0HIK6_SPHPU